MVPASKVNSLGRATSLDSFRTWPKSCLFFQNKIKRRGANQDLGHASRYGPYMRRIRCCLCHRYCTAPARVEPSVRPSRRPVVFARPFTATHVPSPLEKIPSDNHNHRNTCPPTIAPSPSPSPLQRRRTLNKNKTTNKQTNERTNKRTNDDDDDDDEKDSLHPCKHSAFTPTAPSAPGTALLSRRWQ